jgi:copper oxidase (laccase) domain-containing protein
VVPLAVTACKMAWQKLQNYCKSHTDEKSKEACEKFIADPKAFLVTRVLRAGVNPIDAGYRCAPYDDTYQ